MSYVFFAYLESLKCENDMHMLNDRIGAVMSYAVSCCLTLLSARCSLSQRDPHFTLPHHWVSCNSVVRAHLTRSWRVLGLIPIWGSDFSEFSEDPVVIWFNILRDPWKVFSHKHTYILTASSHHFVAKLFTNIANQQRRHYRRSMLLAVETAMVS